MPLSKMKSYKSDASSDMDIAGLNNRLARYIDTARHLELKKGSDNLTKQFHKQANSQNEVDQENEKMSHEVFRLKGNISKNTVKLESLIKDAL